MDWDDARIFLAVAREGTFSKAAKRLGVRHSTVARHIRALEEKLATPLIDRRSSGFVLTAAGEELSRAAERIERELLSFEGAVGGQANVAAGELRVSAIANMASTVLMPIFARFNAANPMIDLRLNTSNALVQLSERDADVAIRQTNAPQETLIGVRLTTVASAVYGAAGYCAALKAGKVREKWIGVECCEHHKAWTREASKLAKKSFTVDDTALTLAAMKEGLGVAYLPCFIGDGDPELVRFREPERQHDIGLWLLYHRDLRNTRRVILFREHMQREIGKIGARFQGGASDAALGCPGFAGVAGLRPRRG